VRSLKSSPKLFADETRCPVLDPGRGKTKSGYLWAIARDDRPWGGTAPPAIAYSYAPGRGGEHAIALVEGFAGVLQVDGYAVYKQLAGEKGLGGVTLAFCWAHVRRKFYEIFVGGNAPIATEALVRIRQLYAIEAEIRGGAPEVAPRPATGEIEAHCRCAETLAGGKSGEDLQGFEACRRDPLWSQPLGRVYALP